VLGLRFPALLRAAPQELPQLPKQQNRTGGIRNKLRSAVAVVAVKPYACPVCGFKTLKKRKAEKHACQVKLTQYLNREL